jgi:hypothetical protein
MARMRVDRHLQMMSQRLPAAAKRVCEAWQELWCSMLWHSFVSFLHVLARQIIVSVDRALW